MKNVLIVFSAMAVSLMLVNCNPRNNATESEMKDSVQPKKSEVTVGPFGTLADGKAVSIYTLTNANGMTMKVINYGGIITSLTAPDKNGTFEDVVLGHDSLGGYLKSNPYFGALIGRYGNRIAKGKFSLDGKTYSLAKNNGENNLHGGPNGFDTRYWNIEQHNVNNGSAVRLSYVSNDLEEGFPGTMKVEVIYHLTDSNELKIHYKAAADKKTVVNLTQHSYFNLSGNTKTDILSQELMLNADTFIPVDKTLIPIGQLKPVSETPFDFKTPTAIGARIDKDDQQLTFGAGYDHCWALNTGGDITKVAATLHDPASGRVMSVYTTEPGIQFYSGNFLDGSITGKQNVVYKHRYGLCLETEHFPDSPNQKNFPSVELAPGQEYRTATSYTFSVKK
jgi:aldose 1-epimerase